MKKIIISIVLALSVFAMANIAAAKVERVPVPVPCSIAGDWVLTFVYGGIWMHDIHIVTMNPDGTFSGTGGYPAGGPYTTTETITGSIVGDNISIHSVYDGSSYYYDAIGTIAPDGSMSGTLTTSAEQVGPWSVPAGAAVCTADMNHGQYVSGQEDKQEAAQTRFGMPVQSIGHIE